VLGAMNIKRATIADATEISALIRSLSKPFLVSPTGEGSEQFYASVNESATAGYLSATNYSYFVARSQGQLVGVVAVRDNSHLFHLFVAEQFQGQGLSSKLWHLAKAEAMDLGNPGKFTVNSSLNACRAWRRPFASTATSLASTSGLSRRIGANSKPVALPLRCILPRRNTLLVPASWVSAFLTSRRSTRRKEVAASSSPRHPRLCTGSSSPSSKTRTARSAISVGSALRSVARASNKR
jgi:GNAT superfamily N-acetyltransferase